MTHLKTVFFGFAVMSCSIASACAGPDSQSSADATSNSAPLAVSSNYLKPGADIRYSHNLKSQINAGEVANFALTLSEPYDAGTLQVSLSTDGNISIVSTATHLAFDMESGDSHVVNISVAGNNNGRHYLNVQALVVSPSGESRPRIFSIPVQVGPATAQKPNPDMKTMLDGENIIEMSAEEEIK